MARKKYAEASSILLAQEHKIRIDLLAKDRGVSSAEILRQVITVGLDGGEILDSGGRESGWRVRVEEWQGDKELLRSEVQRRREVAERNRQARTADRPERVVIDDEGVVQAVGLTVEADDVRSSLEAQVES